MEDRVNILCHNKNNYNLDISPPGKQLFTLLSLYEKFNLRKTQNI